MPKLVDLTGQRYGQLTVISRANNMGDSVAWNCKCDCGNECVIRSDHLREGRTISCPMCGRERQAVAMMKHGEYKSPLYAVWTAMKQRCTNPNCKAYKDYGLRGIMVCDEWMAYENFRDWSKDKYKQGLTIDRIDVNGNYEPNNCRWVTPLVQANNKRDTRFYKVDGVTGTITDFSRIYNIKTSVIERRLRRGWEIKRAITEPYHKEMIHR